MTIFPIRKLIQPNICPIDRTTGVTLVHIGPIWGVEKLKFDFPLNKSASASTHKKAGKLATQKWSQMYTTNDFDFVEFLFFSYVQIIRQHANVMRFLVRYQRYYIEWCAKLNKHVWKSMRIPLP